MRLFVLYPVPNTGGAVSHIAGSLCNEMGKFGERVVYGAVGHADSDVLGGGEDGKIAYRRLSPPRALIRLMYRLGRDPRGILERQFLWSLRAGDVVWLWPGVSEWVFDELQGRGVLVISERINCHRQMARRILWAECDRVGLPRLGGFDDGDIAGETRKLERCDAVFAPSPMVAKSLEEVGVEEGRILRTSYGWDPGRIGHLAACSRSDGADVTFVFVGRGCLRKGLHLLLDAWVKKTIKAKLRIVGKIGDDIEKLHGSTLRRSDVEVMGFVSDVKSVFGSSDVFVFPSLEEGGPLVTYEAMASGLPSIVSPMAAGAVMEDGKHGRVVQPHDVEGWVRALEEFAGDRELRRDMGNAAARHALEYTWKEVGRRRRELIAPLLQRKMVTL